MDGISLHIPKQTLTTIVAIFESRRLLSDHSEVLEECLTNGCGENWGLCRSLSDKYFNGMHCSLLLTTSIIATKFVPERVGVTLCAISTGCAILYLAKRGQFWMLRRSIVNLLDDIDEFDACMRRSISYFRENAFFQSAHQSPVDEINFASKDLITCTQSLVTVIEMIRDVIESLEKTTVSSKTDNLFDPLEDLSELMQSNNEPSMSKLKELYKIFLYIQSHLLTRFSLLLAFDSRQSHVSPQRICSTLTRVIKAEVCRENARYEQLTSIAPSSHSNTIDHVAMEPILNLKSCSISASSKILAIANECRRIDGIVQTVHQLNENKLKDLLTIITQCENAFHVCQSEYQRFVIAYYKAMNLNYCDQSCQAVNGESEFTVENDALQLKIKENEPPDEEEFFTSTERTSDDESKDAKRKPKCWDDELTDKNLRVVKQRFKPVLAQLKGKIEPIAISLRERERNHLLSKGIDPSEFVDCNKINEGFRSCSDSDADDGDECMRYRKPNRYDDMRKFLEGKSQISLIPMRKTTENLLSEDILE